MFRKLFFSISVSLAILVASAAQTHAQITFESSFESGNATGFTESPDDVYSFQLEPDTNSTDREWFYFEVNGAGGKTLTFRLTNTNSHNVPTHWNTARPVYSADGGMTWTHVGGTTSHASNVFTFTHVFTEHSERLAFHFPYAWTMAQEKMDEWETHPDATRSTLGTSVQGRNIEFFRVTDESVKTDYDKLGVWIVCRQHSAEVTSSYAFEGLMDFLLSDDSDAVTLRQNAVVNAIPMTNPDGAVAGNYRNNFAGVNLNRVWDGSANMTNSPEIIVIKQAISDWVNAGKPYDIFFDLHSISAAYPHFAYHSDSSQQPPLYFDPPNYHAHSRAFLALVNGYAPHFHPTLGTTSSTDQRLAYHNQRIQYGVLSFTFEGGYNKQNYGPNSSDYMTPTQHRDIGEAIAKAMVEYYELEPIVSRVEDWFDMEK